MIRKLFKPRDDLNPPWIPPVYAEKVKGYFYDGTHKLRSVEVIYARGQYLTLQDKAIEIIGWN